MFFPSREKAEEPHQSLDTASRGLAYTVGPFLAFLLIVAVCRSTMRLSIAAWVLFLAHNAGAFVPSSPRRLSQHTLSVLAAPSTKEEEQTDVLTLEHVANMSFRELQHECSERGLPSEGTTATLRARIREYICPVDPFTGQEECPTPVEV